MENNNINTNKWHSRIINGVNSFYHSFFFPAWIALVVLSCYILKLDIWGLLFLSISASICFILSKDLSPIMPMLVMAVMIFNDYAVMNNLLPYIFLIPAALSLILHFILYPIKNFRLSGHLLGLLAVSTALFLGGIFSPVNNYVQGLVSSFTLGPVLIIIYIVFKFGIHPPKNFDVKKYFCFTLVCAGLVVSFTLFYYLYHVNILNSDRIKYFSEVGWANVNCLATFLILSIPACFYLIAVSKKWYLHFLYVLIIACYIAGILITRSDGVLYLVILFAPLLLFFSIYKKAASAKQSYILLLILSAITIIGLFCLVLGVFGIAIEASGRADLYKKAWGLFKSHPIFGAGLGYINPDYDVVYKGLRNYNFHSTFFQVLGTMGLVGLISYAFYYVKRIQILLNKKNAFNLFMLIAFVLFECYGFVDTCVFNAIPLMTTLTLLFVVVEVNNEKIDFELCAKVDLSN